MTIKDKILIYIYRKMTEIEEEEKTLLDNLSRKSVDSLDIYEYLRSYIRLQSLNEIMQDLVKIVLNCN